LTAVVFEAAFEDAFLVAVGISGRQGGQEVRDRSLERTDGEVGGETRGVGGVSVV
jgi:hypothetical protein